MRRTPKPEQIRVALTRVCLRGGSVLLPPRTRALLPAEQDRFDGWDAEHDQQDKLGFRNGQLHGLGPFLARHEAQVNDALVIRPQPDGRLALALQPDPFRPANRRGPPVRYGDREAPEAEPPQGEQRMAQQGAQHGGSRATPTTAATAAAADAPADEVHDDPPASDGADPQSLARARSAFEALGFHVEAGRGGTLRLDGGHGRARVRALVRVLDPGTAPDWKALLQAVRDAPVQYLALVGAEADLAPLARPARGARATLWPVEALDRMREKARTVPIGPAELAAAFAEDGLFGTGEEHVVARLRDAMQAQERFLEVVLRLALVRAPAQVRVDDLVEEDGPDRDTVLRALESMSAPPLQWTRRTGAGEYLLPHDLTGALARLRDWTDRTAERLPDATRPRIAVARTDAAESAQEADAIAGARASETEDAVPGER